MAGIMTAKNLMGFGDVRELSLFCLEIHLNLEWGMTYPLDLYVLPQDNPLSLDEKDRGSDRCAYVLHMNRSTLSMNVYSVWIVEMVSCPLPSLSLALFHAVC